MKKHRHDTPTTQRELIDSGRAHFSEVGYSAARTEVIVERTGLTRGALYHHFGSKQGLFVAVLEQIHRELAAEINRRAIEVTAGPTERLRAGFHTWLDVALQDNVRQILLVDGPSVVGWETWHEIDVRHGFGVTRATLNKAMEAKEVDRAPLEELTHMLLGAVTQAGLELGHTGNQPNSREHYHQVIDLLIDNLRVA